jgi:hypothetical protein
VTNGVARAGESNRHAIFVLFVVCSKLWMSGESKDRRDSSATRLAKLVEPG